MTNTLVYQLITALTAAERREAQQWLDSPIHNQRKDILDLYLIIAEWHHDLHLIPNREQLYQRLFPNKDFDDQELRLLSSYLLKCLEEWLNWRGWKRNQDLISPHLLKAYRDKGLEKHFRRQLRTQRRLLERSPLRHPEYYWSLFQLERADYEWESSMASARGRLFNLQEQEDALQIAFLGMKLRQACFTVAHQQVFKANYRLALLDEFLQLAQEAPYTESPAVQVYYYGYLTYVDETPEQAFQHFKTLFFTHFSCFPAREARDLLLLGINFCIRRINREGNAFLQEALDLYQKGLENDLLLEDGWLRPFTVNNIIGIALRLQALEWVKLFLAQYKNRIEPRRREAIVALNSARIAYSEGHYNDALRQLHRADDRDFIHQMTVKTLQLKIYYEGEDFELLSAHIKNTKAFIRRRRNQGYHERIYLNIFSLTEQLLKVNPYDHKQKQLLRERITHTDPLTEKEWLLKQLK